MKNHTVDLRPKQDVNNLPMNIVFVKGNKPVTTSLIVADNFGKRHDNVVRDIEQLIENTKEFNALNFEATSYTVKNKTHKAYEMDRDGFTLLAMGFTGTKALQFKIQYIAAFNAMEQKLMEQQKPTIPTDLSRMQLIQLAMDAETERLAAVKEIKRLAPKAEAWEEFSESDGLYPLTMAFKFLKLQPNVHTKRMLEDNILYKLNKVNVPFQRYIQQGYFELKTKEDDGVFTQTYVTPKGLEFLKRKYKGMKYLEVIS